MNRTRLRTSKKLTPIAYLVLGLFVCMFLVTVWFSSYQDKTIEEVREELEPHKNFLLDEISELERQEAKLTSVKNIHKIAKKLNMVQSSNPVQILRDDKN